MTWARCRCCTSSTGRSSARSRRPSTRSSATSEELDEDCPLCPTEGRDPGKLEVKLGRYGKFIGCTNYPDCQYIRNMDGSVRPEPEMLDETLPRMRQAVAEARGPVRSVRRMQRLPRLQVHQEGPARLDRRHLPAVRAGRADREAEPVRHDVLQLQPLPRLRLRRGQPAGEGPPVSRSAARCCSGGRSQLRCWGCGAELDLDFNVTKEGDVEAETAARAAKADRQGGARRCRRSPPRRSPRRRSRAPRSPRRRRSPPRRRSRPPASNRRHDARLHRSPPPRRPRRARPRGLRRRRGRRTPRNPCGDAEGPPHPPGVLPPARGHEHLLARGLGGVRGGDVPGHHAVGLGRPRRGSRSAA